MKVLSIPVIVLLLLSAPMLHSQAEYAKADSLAASFSKSYSDASGLARQLTESLANDQEKARVLFTWIAQNIRYDCDKYRHPAKVKFSGDSKEAVAKEQEKWQVDQIRQTLRRKKGVCEDYSRLYKAMCDSVGLEAAVIEGTARSFYKPFRKLPAKPNHTWNAVKIGGQWRLLDVTWAAGYVDEDVTKFTEEFQPGYFLAPPAWFAQEHFPTDEKWQLLDTLVTREAFPEQVLAHFGQVQYPIVDFQPRVGAPPVVNGKMEIRIKFRAAPPAVLVVSRNIKPIPFEQTEVDGYTVLRFDEPGKGEISVFGGEKKGKKGWLLRCKH